MSNKSEKMWALLVHLSYSQWRVNEEKLEFDEKLWDYIIDESAKSGVNTIVLDLGNAVQYDSHPEIVCEGAWSKERVHQEIARCREKNITLLPKLNLSACHDIWLGEYHYKLSTPEYYQVIKDLLQEIYEMFEQPEYIHIGMDEEDHKHARALNQLVVYRQGELYWHDLRFYIDIVKELGAKPWMWSCPLFDNPEEYKKRIGADEALLSPWYYNAFHEENWTPVQGNEILEVYYNADEYLNMDIKFIEDDPFLVRFRQVALPLMKEGYKYVPCASTANNCDCNTDELLEYFKVNAPDDQMVGYITAPWKKTVMENKDKFDLSLKFLKEAKEKYYN